MKILRLIAVSIVFVYLTIQTICVIMREYGKNVGVRRNNRV